MSAKKFIRDTFLRLFSRRPTSPIRKRRVGFGIGMEMLEDRTTPTISVSGPSAGVLTFTGNGANDTLVIESTATPGTIKHNAGLGLTSVAGVSSIVFNGNGGNNVLVLADVSGNILAPTAGTAFNVTYNAGGSGTGELDFIGGGAAWTSSYTPSGAKAGTVNFSSGTNTQSVGFSGVPTIRNSMTAANLAVTAPSTNDTINVFAGPSLNGIAGVSQGPAVIDGGDRDEHGSFASGANQNGWKFIEQSLNFLRQTVFNPGPFASDVLVVGTTAGTEARQAVDSACSVLGLSRTYVTGAQITAATFAQYRILYVPCTQPETIGGITQGDLNLLAARTSEIRDFVNSGGGLFALSEDDSATPYNWLQIPNAFGITKTLTDDTNMFRTPALVAAGFTITNAELTNGTPVHIAFTGPPGFNNLDVFVTNAAVGGQVITLGHAAIQSAGYGGGGPTTDINFNGAYPRMYVNATTGLTLNGGDGTDKYNIQTGTPGITNIAIADALNQGADTANLWGTNGADQWDVNYTTAKTVSFGSPATETITYTANLEAMTVNGPVFQSDPPSGTPVAPADLGDTFRVAPDVNTAITVNGDNPVVSYGDTLILNAVGLTSAAVLPAPPLTARPNGQLTSTSHKTVSWTSIETLPVPLGLGGTFDFGNTAAVNDPATQPGFLPVLPTDTPTSGQYASAGDGWVNPGMGGYNRVTQFDATLNPNSPLLSPLLRDAEWGYLGGGANNGVFRVSVAPGQDVQVTAIIGDNFSGRDNENVYVSTSPGGPTTKLNPTLSTFTSAGQPYQFVSYSGVVNPGANPALYFTIETAHGGTSGFWVINALDVRPVGMIAPLTIVKTSGGGNGSVVADGLTVDTYANAPNTGALPNSELTISPQYGTPSGVDADPVMKGFQVIADINGAFTFSVLRSTGAGPATITVTDVTGASGTGLVTPTDVTGSGAPLGYSAGFTLPSQYQQTYTLPTVRRIDFGPGGQVVGSDSVVGNTNYLGYGSSPYVSTVANALGWVGTTPSTADRGTGSAVQRDFAWNAAGSGSDGDYELDFPNANSPYVVTALLGDPTVGHDNLFVQIINPATGLPSSTPVSGLSIPAGQSTSVSIPVTTDTFGTFGRVRLRFGSVTGAPNGTWTVQAIDARPAVGSAVAGAQLPLTVNSTTFAQPGPTALAGSPAADGTVTTNYNLTGATPFAVLTVSSTLGTITTADGATAYTGFQVVANNLGAASFTIRSPLSTSNVTGTITITETTGTKLGVFSQNYTGVTTAVPPAPPAPAAQRYDFNGSANNVTAPGFTGVLPGDAYNATRGYGWLTSVAEYDRGTGTGGPPTELFRDGAWGYTSGTFGVAAPAGAMRDVRVYVGDPYWPWPGITVTAEGGTPVAVDPAAGQYGFVTVSGTNNGDGVFTITINAPLFVVSGLDIASTGGLPLPASPVASIPGGGRRLDFNSTPTDTAGGFTAVAPNAQYSAAAGYGWGQGVNDFSRAASTLPGTMTAVQNSLYRDGAWGNGAQSFLIGVTPLSQASIRAYVGDSYAFWQGETISIEGGPTVPVTANFAGYALTGTDVNGDGIITVTISAQVWVLNGMDIVAGPATGLPPMP